MTTLGKSAAALVACAAAAFSWWAFVETSAPPSPVAASEVGERVRPVAAASLGVKAAERELVPTSKVPAALDLRQPFAFELRARVVDADGLPIAGAHLAVAPPGCALALSPQQTDANGCVAMTWQARVPALTIAVGLAYQGSHTALQELRVVAGTIAELHFVGGNAPMPAQVRIDELGRQIVTMPDCAQGQADCRKCHEGLPGVNLFTVRGSWQAGLHPDAVFGDRLAVAPPNPAPESGWTIGVSGPRHFGIAPAAPRSRITGRVFSANGEPAAGVRVWVYRTGVGGGGMTTKADGAFRLGWPNGSDGEVSVRAGGGPEGLATRTVDLRGDGIVPVDLILETGRTLCGRALGADGGPLNGARVEFVGAPGGDSDLATVGPDGAFAFANLPPGPARLLLWGVRGEKLPIAEERAIPLADGEVMGSAGSGDQARAGVLRSQWRHYAVTDRSRRAHRCSR